MRLKAEAYFPDKKDRPVLRDYLNVDFNTHFVTKLVKPDVTYRQPF